MEEIESLSLGREKLDFKIIRGIVAGDKKWSDTHVYSSGGGGYVGPQGGYIGMPSVKSQVVPRHEVWVREEGSDKEFPLDLSGKDVPLREGHKIALVSAFADEDMRLFFLINKTTQKVHHIVSTNLQKFASRAARIEPVSGLWLTFVALMCAAIIGFGGMFLYPEIELFVKSSKEQAAGVKEVAQAMQIDPAVIKYKSFFDLRSTEHNARIAYQVKNLGIKKKDMESGRNGEDRANAYIAKLVMKKFGGAQIDNIYFRFYFYKDDLGEKIRTKIPREKAEEIFLFLNGYSLPSYEQYFSYIQLVGSAREHGVLAGFAIGILTFVWGAILASRKHSKYCEQVMAVDIELKGHLTQMKERLLLGD